MKIFNSKKLMPALLAALFVFASCQNPNDQPATEEEITEGGETIISEITTEELTTTSATTSAATELATTITSAAAEEPTITEPPEIEPSEPETTISASETAESQITAITTEQATVTPEETTTETEETTATELEVEDDLYNMPEIVFYLSYRDQLRNTVLQCITRDGRFKHYSFPKEEYMTIYSFSGIENYDKIEEICVDTDIDPMSKDDLFKLYEMLLNIDEDSGLVYSPLEGALGSAVIGRNSLYGVRFNINEELKLIPLGVYVDVYGDINSYNSDPNSIELLETLKEIFPDSDNFYKK